MQPDELLTTQGSRAVKLTGDGMPNRGEHSTVESHSRAGDPSDAHPCLSSTVDDEYLRARIRRLIDERSLSSGWRLYLLPAAVVILASILGALLIHYYSSEQRRLDILRAHDQRESDRLRETERRESYRIREVLRRESDAASAGQGTEGISQERSRQMGYVRPPETVVRERPRVWTPRESDYERAFHVATNTIRLEKIDEVLDKIDKTESEIDRILGNINRVTNSLQPEKAEDQSTLSLTAYGLTAQQERFIEDNKYWFGEELYNQLKKYHAANKRYVGVTIIGPRGMDVSRFLNERAQEKENTLKLRRVFLDKTYSAPELFRRARE